MKAEIVEFENSVRPKRVFFYRNTETDRNRIFVTETEITETETKPNFFYIDFLFTLQTIQKYSFFILDFFSKLNPWQIFFKNSIIPTFSGKR